MTLTDDQVLDLCRRRNAGIAAAVAATQPVAAALLTGAKPEDLQALVSRKAPKPATPSSRPTPVWSVLVVARYVHGSRHYADYIQGLHCWTASSPTSRTNPWTQLPADAKHGCGQVSPHER